MISWFCFVDSSYVNVLWGNLPKTELSTNRGRDNGLRTGTRKGALDTVDRQRWIAHTSHEHRRLIVRDRDLGPSCCFKISD